jgi:sarcosine oxidase subunit gamma
MTIAENPDLSVASVAARLGQEASCQERLSTLLGADPPLPGEALLRDPVSAIWTGADQWMMTASYSDHENLAGDLKSHLGETASVTEQSDAWVCFDISGNDLEALFERLCPVPLRRLATGAAQRTTIDHLGCFVILTQSGQVARVLGPRSSAASLHHAVTTAAISIA